MNTTEHSKLKLTIRSMITGMFYANPVFSDSLSALRMAESIHVNYRKDKVTPEVSHQFNMVGYFINLIGIINYSVTDREEAYSIINDCITTLFLHDSIEDYPEVADEVNSKFKQAKYINMLDKTSYETDADYYNALASDIRTVIVKAIDRIHNLSTIKVLGEEKTKKYVEHTRTYVLPMLVSARKKYPEYVQLIENLKSNINIIINVL